MIDYFNTIANICWPKDTFLNPFVIFLQSLLRDGHEQYFSNCSNNKQFQQNCWNVLTLSEKLR